MQTVKNRERRRLKLQKRCYSRCRNTNIVTYSSIAIKVSLTAITKPKHCTKCLPQGFLCLLLDTLDHCYRVFRDNCENAFCARVQNMHGRAFLGTSQRVLRTAMDDSSDVTYCSQTSESKIYNQKKTNGGWNKRVCIFINCCVNIDTWQFWWWAAADFRSKLHSIIEKLSEQCGRGSSPSHVSDCI